MVLCGLLGPSDSQAGQEAAPPQEAASTLQRPQTVGASYPGAQNPQKQYVYICIYLYIYIFIFIERERGSIYSTYSRYTRFSIYLSYIYKKYM